MDTIIEAAVTKQKNKKRLLVISLIIIMLIAAVWLLRYYFKPSLTANEITIAKVEVGIVEYDKCQLI